MPILKRRKAENEEPLLVPLDYEIERSGRRVRLFLFALLTFLVAVLAILAIAPLHEVARADGWLATDAEIVELSHVDGGEVVEVFVKKATRSSPERPSPASNP